MNLSRTRASGLVGGIALLALVYFVAGRLSLLLAIPPGYATAIWPGAGIALAALLIYGRRLWPGVVLGSFLVNLSVDFDLAFSPSDLKSISIALAISIGAGAQALLGSVLVQRFIRQDPGLLELRNILGLLILGGPVSCLANSTWSASALLLGGLIDASGFGFNWITWWVGDSIGVLVVLPLVLIWLGQPRAVWSKRRFVVTIPLTLFFALAVIGFLFANQQEQKSLEIEFARSGEVAGDSLDKHIVRYLEVVHGIQSYFASTGSVSRDQFRTFVGRTLQRIPGIQALSWNPRVTAAERAAYEAAARRDGSPQFSITERDKDGRLVRAAGRSEYVTVYYIEPYASNKDALGYDVYSQPTRRAALDLARDSGEAVVTAPITLVQETGAQTGVLVFVPIYRSGRVPENIEHRRSGLLGYAVGVFRLGDVLAAALEGLGVADVEARFFDDTDADNASLLAVYRVDDHGFGRVVPSSEVAAPAGAFTYSRRYHVAGRYWRLVLIPDRNYLATRRSWTGWGVLAGGLSFASLLGAFLLALTGRWILDERRVEELAETNSNLNDEVAQRIRTEQALHAEKERAEVTLHSIGDAVITTDADGVVEYLNPVAEKLTEWRSAEARGRQLREVFRIVNEETQKPAADPIQRCLDEGRIVGLANHTVMISRSGREYAIEDSAAPIRDHQNQVQGVVLVFHDVSESRRMMREAAHYAAHDTLTGLVNRREFDRRLERALVSSKRYGTQHALCYLDLDQFKIVNDTCGHRAGDELLKQVASLLAHKVRDRDTLARLGGDEFGLLLDNCPPDKALEIADTLVTTIRDFHFEWDKRPFSIGVSIGLVPIAGQVETAETLLSHADVACYAAKDLGRNRVHVYTADFSGADPRHREILHVADMRSAIDQNRFRLYCQPVWSLDEDTPRLRWHELLLRMFDKDNRLVLPQSFVPVAERFGLMGQIDRWVVYTALREYRDLFPDDECPSISINLSGNLLGDDKLLGFLCEQFETHGVDPERICFEVTETAAIRNISTVAHVFRAIRDIGGKFALDDFGSGLSSFAYLKALPVDYLKIDGSLVRGAASESDDRAMIEAINQLAHRMGIQTVAEYVEMPDCVQVLREIGVDYAQGFALGGPEPLPWRKTHPTVAS